MKLILQVNELKYFSFYSFPNNGRSIAACWLLVKASILTL